MSVGLDRLGWLFVDTHFIGPLKLEPDDAQNLPIMKTPNNPINLF